MRMGSKAFIVILSALLGAACSESRPRLTIEVVGSGGGKVETQGVGSCSTNQSPCVFPVSEDAQVTLVPTAQDGDSFSVWSGACTGSAECQLRITGNTRVVARFEAVPVSTLHLNIQGSGTGTVAFVSGDEPCRGSCERTHPLGGRWALRAVADSDSDFVGWSTCGKNTSCLIDADEDVQLSARFEKAETHPVTATKSGSGTGIVTSLDGRISCGDTCTARYRTGEPVTLKADGDAGAVFVGWEGACTGHGLCQLNVNEPLEVTARFMPSHTVSITKTGVGTGRVSSSDEFIECGPTCQAVFAEETRLHLDAAPSQDSAFRGWTGACTGEKPCEFSVSADSQVQATFVPALLWDRNIGGGNSGMVTLRDVTMDSQQNVIVLGEFERQADFGGGVLFEPNWAQNLLGGTKDVVVSKYDKHGNHVWSKRFGDVEDQWGIQIATDELDSIYFAAGTHGDVDFGCGTPLHYNSPLGTPAPNDEIMLVKLDASGNCLAQAGSSTPYTMYGDGRMAVSASGDVYLGIFSLDGLMSFGSIAVAAADESVLFRFSSNLTPVWGRKLSTNSQPVHASLLANMALLQNGDLIVAGGFVNQTVDIGCGPSATQTNVLVARLSSAGACLWMNEMADWSNSARLYPILTVDKESNIYVGMAFDQALAIQGITYSATSLLDTLVMRLSASGTPSWTRWLKGNSSYADVGFMTFDLSNALVLAGALSFEAGVPAYDGIELGSSSPGAPLAFRVDPADGTLLSRRNYSSAGGAVLYGAHAGPDGSVVLVGAHGGYLDFGDGPMPPPGAGTNGFIGVVNP